MICCYSTIPFLFAFLPPGPDGCCRPFPLSSCPLSHIADLEVSPTWGKGLALSALGPQPCPTLAPGPAALEGSPSQCWGTQFSKPRASAPTILLTDIGLGKGDIGCYWWSLGWQAVASRAGAHCAPSPAPFPRPCSTGHTPEAGPSPRAD